MNGIEFIVRQMRGYRPPPTTTAELRERIIELRKTQSARAISHELGVSITYVYTVWRNHSRRGAA